MLAVYPREQGKYSRVSWSDFQKAFGGCEIKTDRNDKRDYRWIVVHPLGDVRFYAPVSGLLRKSVHAAHFVYEDVAAIWNERAVSEHPFWMGIHRLVADVGMMLAVELPFAKGFVIGEKHRAEPVPSWAEKCYKFEVNTGSDMQRIIASAADMQGRIAALTESKSQWADTNYRDEESLTAFRNFVLGKRRPKPELEWAGSPLRLSSTPGSFQDAYGTWVDWRDVDADVIDLFADSLKHDKLTAKETETGLYMEFKGRSKELTLQEIGKNRYNAIRGLNAVLAPDYEVRAVKNSTDGDTHCFSLAPSWLWNNLESESPGKSDKKFKRIDADDDF